MTDMHDVVIVGAGPGGSAAAHYLAQHGLDVLLLDKANFPRDKTCGDALTPRALAVLDEMGLLNELVRIGRRINSVEIVAPRGDSITAPLPKTAGWPEYALIIPRLILDNAIRERAVASGATFRSPVRVLNIAREGAGVVVTGEQHGQSVTFRGRVA